ncbi:MAG TPA: phosphatidylglycerol lysyltransferase domain-containing protein, partial [Micavibrio sp.]
YAFGNFWQLDNRQEITIDLMRYDPEAPANIMEYLFVASILWAQESGYQWFGLGMAPFSGMEKHSLASLWHKIGSIIYEHGEDFYNFEGLHAYKSKFGPVWKPRYMATPPGPRIPMVLISVAGIIAGGIRGILRK